MKASTSGCPWNSRKNGWRSYTRFKKKKGSVSAEFPAVAESPDALYIIGWGLPWRLSLYKALITHSSNFYISHCTHIMTKNVPQLVSSPDPCRRRDRWTKREGIRPHSQLKHTFLPNPKEFCLHCCTTCLVYGQLMVTERGKNRSRI